ncbi:MAG: phage major capsid protein [Clostridiales bacterium]|nr:phage major capsid protein [Clostridiales bacterium]
MAFDNIKLEKGLYATSKGFTGALEEIDPSENYKGTALEGLDAYQRQLKRYDIKVSGNGSDSVSKFFETTDSAALFPEYVSRAVRQGAEEADVLSKIIATTTTIDSLDYRAIESAPDKSDKRLADVAEGAAIPETVIRTKETLTTLHKRGRMLVASYEAIKFQKLDLFTVTLKQIGAYIARCQLEDAIEALDIDDMQLLSLSGSELSYADLVNLWNLFDAYKMTTLLAGPTETAALINMSEFRDSTAGLDFHGTGRVITPLGAELIKCASLDSNAIIALDKNAALEKVQAGEVMTEYDKLIDRQLERAAITCTAGFSKIFEDAVQGIAL